MTHRNLSPLFEGHLLRAIVEAACEARLGLVAADDTDAPSVARLSLGCYAVVGGDPRHPLARKLVETVERPREIVYGNDPAWRRLILDVHASRVVDRPMRIFDASGLDRDALRGFEPACPPGFELRCLDVGLTRQLDRELEPHGLQVFPDAEALVRDGMGHGIVTGDGTLACAAGPGPGGGGLGRADAA